MTSIAVIITCEPGWWFSLSTPVVPLVLPLAPSREEEIIRPPSYGEAAVSRKDGSMVVFAAGEVYERCIPLDERRIPLEVDGITLLDGAPCPYELKAMIKLATSCACSGGVIGPKLITKAIAPLGSL